MRPGPYSAMRHLYSGLALWCLAIQVAFLVLAVVQPRHGVVSPRAFQLSAVFMAVFTLAVHSILIIHFIGSMKWIQQSGPTAGVEDTESLRRAWIKGALFPLLVLAMLVAVAVAILAGGSQFADLPQWVILVLAAANVILGVLILPIARRGITANKLRMSDMAVRMQHRSDTGALAQEPQQELLPESGAAGGKTLMFLGANVWILYAYRRWVLRHGDEPLWPYAVFCGLCLLIGLSLFRRFRSEA